MNVPDRRLAAASHPWQGIDLDVYERHMGDVRVGQLEQLHAITGEQLDAYTPHAVGVLGVAGGNGLDLIDPDTTELVFGYDVNANYLAACEARYRMRLGVRLRLVEASIDRFMRIEPVDLLVANLIVEYVGVVEFVAFLATNAPRVGVVSCVVQRNDAAGFVSSTEHASSFAGLSSVAADVDPDALQLQMVQAGFDGLGRWEYPLPNGKALVRQDFRVSPASTTG